MADRWEGIDSFTAVAETGSFTRAAANLDISISQVSREVRRLEGRLGTRLLLRTTRKVALTEAGALFEQKCRDLIAEREAAFESLSATESDVKGHIRLTCPVAYGEKMIVPIVNQFIKTYPAVSIHIELTNHLLDIIADGFDLAIRIDDQPDPRLTYTRLTSRALHCCASPDYLRAKGTPSSIGELDRHDCLMGSAEHWRFTLEGRDIQIRPRVHWRCNSGFAVTEAAVLGLGICQLPDFYVATHLEDGMLTELLADHRPRDQDFMAVYPARAHRALRVTALIEFIKNRLHA
jgi:DNA-binding transcriptional LysR family regulator